jgi:PIN domain nuclease of toxin-antitoxin system
MRLSRRVVDALGTLTLREAPMGFDIAQETARVQLPHRDPADCFLIATARIFGLPLVTGDETILKSVAVLANR